MDNNTLSQLKAGEIEFHEYANIFPLIEGEEFDALVYSVKTEGLYEPIWLYDGKIIDGRNRYLACLAAEVEPKFQQYEGDDPLGFAITKNIRRRHLTASQRACAAVEYLPYFETDARRRMLAGKKIDPSQKVEQGRAADLAAEMFSVNRQYIYNARQVKQERPDLFEVMQAGGMHMKEALHEIHEEERQDSGKPEKIMFPYDRDGDFAALVTWATAEEEWIKEKFGGFPTLEEWGKVEVEADKLSAAGDTLAALKLLNAFRRRCETILVPYNTAHLLGNIGAVGMIKELRQMKHANGAKEHRDSINETLSMLLAGVYGEKGEKKQGQRKHILEVLTEMPFDTLLEIIEEMRRQDIEVSETRLWRESIYRERRAAKEYGLARRTTQEVPA